MKKTPLYECHIASAGKIVDFVGWALPVNYGSQINEHELVRTDAGMFDVSHMCITDIKGAQARQFLRYLLSNDVNKLDKAGIGKALYSAMLTYSAGIIDDLTVYLLPFGYRLVTNAATYTKDMAWINKIAEQFDVEIMNRYDLAMLAVQGPNAIAKVTNIFPEIKCALLDLKLFTSIDYNGYFFARTGYTGESGLEIMFASDKACDLWQKLLKEQIAPCGLGARDTLRLEAGMNLYGHDMSETTNPLECGLGWVVDLSDMERDFVGKETYLELKQNKNYVGNVQQGLILQGSGVLREGQKLFVSGREVGVITSGTFSPTLKTSIAIAQIKAGITNFIKVAIRDKLVDVRVVKIPFVRNGKILVV